MGPQNNRHLPAQGLVLIGVQAPCTDTNVALFEVSRVGTISWSQIYCPSHCVRRWVTNSVRLWNSSPNGNIISARKRPTGPDAVSYHGQSPSPTGQPSLPSSSVRKSLLIRCFRLAGRWTPTTWPFRMPAFTLSSTY